MKKLFLSVLVLLSFIIVKAQNFHLTLFTGVSNYQGDLQPKYLSLKQAGFAFGVGGLYEITPQLYLRGNITFGQLKASDSKYSRNASRNLSFSTPITDIHVGVEYDFLNSYEHLFTPYAFTGISVFHFNPTTIDATGGVAFLHELGTEGQGFVPGRKIYNLTQLSIPFGAGVKYAISENLKVRFEIGFRKTFTDYIDDVSTSYANPNQLLLNNGQRALDLAYRSDEYSPALAAYPVDGRIRGNPNRKDWYYFAGFGLSFRISE